MREARAFFYVSLGILALAGAFHLAVGSARGQSGMATVGGLAVKVQGGPIAAAVDENGMIWGMDHNAETSSGPLAPPKPGAISSVVVYGAGAGGIDLATVLYVDGDFYDYARSFGGWSFLGNLFSGAPVQATETTWGRVKADRR